ncbi:hypothetical protein HNQ91_001004 [Filimonas zeae]|nr:hypothetical protein [Filimonas zeae]MDR6337982.1 hypothetical protein [Filimonas zeae]
MIKIEAAWTAADWHAALNNDTTRNNDCLIFCEEQDDLVWFATTYIQYLAVMGGNEVMPFYGHQIHRFADFVYQANHILPVGYRMVDNNVHALYDLLLNFETEPPYRYLFWNNAQHLFQKNSADFSNVFEPMIVAAYCNRNGISTIKEDNTRYKVHQRNFFFFHKTEWAQLSQLLEMEYYIPSIDGPFDKKLDFNIVLLEPYRQTD